MSIDAQVYTAPALLTGTISLGLAVYVFRRRNPVFDARGLVTYLASSGLISFLFVGIILARSRPVMVVLLNGAFTLLFVGGLGLLHFSLAFAGRLEALTRRRAALTGGLAAALTGALWTNRLHGTFRADVELYTEPVRIVNAVYGPTGQLGVLFVFSLGLVSAYFILNHLYRSETLYRIQGLIVVTAVLLPMLGSALSLADWPNPAINVTPVFTVTSAILYTVAVTRYGFLDIVPLAHEEVVDNMDDGLVVTDPTGTVLSVNSSAQRLIDEQEPLGQQVDDLLPLDRTRPELPGKSDSEDRWGGEITIERQGAEFTFDVRSVPIHASEGRYLGRAVTLRDISALKNRERRLQQQNDQLDQLVSVASHDLRNPLNVAQMRASLLSKESENQDVDAIQDALARMEKIIDDMLTLARSGEELQTTERCHLGTLVENSWENVRTDGSRLDAQVDDLSVRGDRSRLLHVFENLFRNAVEHNEGPVTIRVGSLDGAEGFYVEDSGEGIPEERRTDIFEHGYTTSDGGSGLGLNIVGDIVDAHGWGITVAESEDGGARFEVRTDFRSV